MLERTQFLGLECVRLANPSLALLITSSLGPRIIALKRIGGDNLFAEIPDFTLDCPERGTLHLWGGHRLWHAPEKAERTYLPDVQAPAIEEIMDGLRIIQPLEIETGIQKSLTVRLPDDKATVVVDHHLQNLGLWPVTLAPWAITQLDPGGFAILPQNLEPSDPGGFLPNRKLALWPYTDLKSPHLKLGKSFIFISAAMTDGAMKIGFPNSSGWLAYYNKNTLFVKQAAYNPSATYFDYGSSSECFCNPWFLELETLGPQTTLAPGETVTHRETWHVFDDIELIPSEAEISALALRLGLDTRSTPTNKG